MIKTRPAEVISGIDGHKLPAMLITCGHCGNDAWFIYSVGEHEHQHLQCTRCNMTFCDGSCLNNLHLHPPMTA